MKISQKQIEDKELLKLFEEVVWPLKMPPLPNTRELMLRFAQNCFEVGYEKGRGDGYEEGVTYGA